MLIQWSELQDQWQTVLSVAQVPHSYSSSDLLFYKIGGKKLIQIYCSVPWVSEVKWILLGTVLNTSLLWMPVIIILFLFATNIPSYTEENLTSTSCHMKVQQDHFLHLQKILFDIYIKWIPNPLVTSTRKMKIIAASVLQNLLNGKSFCFLRGLLRDTTKSLNDGMIQAPFWSHSDHKFNFIVTDTPLSSTSRRVTDKYATTERHGKPIKYLLSWNILLLRNSIFHHTTQIIKYFSARQPTDLKMFMDTTHLSTEDITTV